MAVQLPEAGDRYVMRTTGAGYKVKGVAADVVTLTSDGGGTDVCHVNDLDRLYRAERYRIPGTRYSVGVGDRWVKRLTGEVHEVIQVDPPPTDRVLLRGPTGGGTGVGPISEMPVYYRPEGE